MKPKLSFSFSTPSSSDVEALWHAHELVCKFYRDFLELLEMSYSRAVIFAAAWRSREHGCPMGSANTDEARAPSRSRAICCTP